MLHLSLLVGKLHRVAKQPKSFFEYFLPKSEQKYLQFKQPTLTVGILHYNESVSLIERAVKSITVQHLSVKIKIYCDGGAVKLPNMPGTEIKYLKRHAGPGYVRNNLIKDCDTDYITFLDGDDVLNPGAIKVFYDSIKKYHPDLVYTTRQEETSAGQYIKHPDLFCLTVCHGKVYNVNFLKTNKIIFREDIILCEDMYFNLEIYNKTRNIYFINKNTYT